jgi:hypothetical protein
LFIVDAIKDHEIIPLATCIKVLKNLKDINDQLPIHEIDKRIQTWENK